MTLDLNDPEVRRQALEEARFFRRTVLDNPWIPEEVRAGVTERQAEFLTCHAREILYGGATKGGKTWGALMWVAQYLDQPGYSVGIFRDTLQNLRLPDGMIPLSHAWWDGTPARYDSNTHTWTFPTGKQQSPATVQFGYMEDEDDHLRYRGAGFQRMVWEEVTLMREAQYRYLFSRLTRRAASAIPLQVASTTNPGGPGHAWVHKRFIEDGPINGRVFISARLEDNRHVDQTEIEMALRALNPVEYAQLRWGDWDVVNVGGRFVRTWFRYCDAGMLPPVPRSEWVRYWDLAATEQSKKSRDPDWTVGALVCWHEGLLYVLDIRRVRASPTEVDLLIKSTAYEDGQDVRIVEEQEPGSSGVRAIDAHKRMLQGFNFVGDKVTGNKHTRIRILQSAARPVGSAEHGNVVLRRAPWNQDFLDEAEAYQADDRMHDDQLDAIAGAMTSSAQYAGHVTSMTHGLFSR